MNANSIFPIPALDDNYIWCLHHEGDAVVVDPGDPQPVADALRTWGLRLRGILVTHHHYDHIDGIPGLLAAFPGIAVYGPDDVRAHGVTRTVGEGARIRLDVPPIDMRVMALPGHTRSHIAWCGGGVLFCGDVLFSAGCGRVFEGTMETMAASLDRIAALPPETLVYCAHEYTLDNLGFARWVEPDSPALARREAEAKRLRAAGRPTVPTTFALERETNPFLRTRTPAVKAAAERHAGHPLDTPAAVFAELRQWKDREYD